MPEKKLLKIQNQDGIKHVIFWAENRIYHEEVITKEKYEELKKQGFPEGL